MIERFLSATMYFMAHQGPKHEHTEQAVDMLEPHLPKERSEFVRSTYRKIKALGIITYVTSELISGGRELRQILARRSFPCSRAWRTEDISE